MNMPADQLSKKSLLRLRRRLIHQYYPKQAMRRGIILILSTISIFNLDSSLRTIIVIWPTPYFITITAPKVMMVHLLTHLPHHRFLHPSHHLTEKILKHRGRRKKRRELIPMTDNATTDRVKPRSRGSPSKNCNPIQPTFGACRPHVSHIHVNIQISIKKAKIRDRNHFSTYANCFAIWRRIDCQS